MAKEIEPQLETLDLDETAKVSGGYYSFTINGPGYAMTYGDGPRYWGHGHRHAYRAYRRWMRQQYYYGGGW
jgi:hypothetical protein